VFLIDADDRVVVLRNEGGNKNGWLQVRLEGVNAGNNKNNIDGIGSKVEVKVGDLYQIKYITEPITHFGVGAVKGADVLRVVWTNGVPQNVILPQANQRLLEKQVLKGSCPFLYVYDGEKYQFLTDLLWRSPLGMITSRGTPAFADSAQDYVKIPGDRMKPFPPFQRKDTGGISGAVYSLQITEELWETAYFDQVKLIAVDHLAGTQIFVDEKFIPPPFPEFKIYTAREIHARAPHSTTTGAMCPMRSRRSTIIMPLSTKPEHFRVWLNLTSLSSTSAMCQMTVRSRSSSPVGSSRRIRASTFRSPRIRR